MGSVTNESHSALRNLWVKASHYQGTGRNDFGQRQTAGPFITDFTSCTDHLLQPVDEIVDFSVIQLCQALRSDSSY